MRLGGVDHGVAGGFPIGRLFQATRA